MVSSQLNEVVRYPDGRVGLASPDEINDSRYANGDLAPVPIERRTWTTYNYTALWIGMSHCIPTYLLASGLIALGMVRRGPAAVLGADGTVRRAVPRTRARLRRRPLRSPS